MTDPLSILDERQVQEAEDEVSENRISALQMIEEMTPENFRLFWEGYSYALARYAAQDQEIPF